MNHVIGNRSRTLGRLLLDVAEQASGAGCRYFPTGSIDGSMLCTYQVLVQQAQRILGGLRGLGVRPCDKVAILLNRPSDFLPVFWACVLGGFAPCPLTPQQGDQARWAAQLEHIAVLFDHPVLITTADLRQRLPASSDLSAVVLDTLMAGEPDSAIFNARAEDIAVFMLTSGSTGKSKAVPLTHQNLLAAVAAKMTMYRQDTGDVMLNWVAFDHVAALEIHLSALVVGATQLHVEPDFILDDPLRFVELISAHGVTGAFTPNFLFGQIIQAIERLPIKPDWNLSTLRAIASGGEAVVCQTGERFLDQLAPFGLKRDVLKPAFGMTETFAGCVFSDGFPDMDAGQEFASVGSGMPGLRMRIVGETDAPLPDSQVGELQLRGPMVFGGYLDNPDATAAAFTADGWFRTGDLGVLHDGRLTLVGRNKDSVIVNGVNYFSHELEAAIETIDGVEKSCVAAFPTRPKGSDTEQLAVIFSPAFPLDDEPALHRLLIGIRNNVILHWGFRPSVMLPVPKELIQKTSLGKIQRSALRKRLEAGDFSDRLRWISDVMTRQLGGYQAPSGAVEMALVDIYADIFDLNPAVVSANANFFDLGGTSLDAIRLRRRARQRFTIPDLPTVWLLQHPTVRELAARIESYGSQQVAEYNPLVPLQHNGAKTPLFCVHPGGGDVLVFVNLAKYFVHDRPVHALRAPGFEPGERYFATFPELVDCYVRAVRAEQPHGPYAVAGYSYGATVAFEIAKALESDGERVDFVGIIDFPPDAGNLMHELDAKSLLLLAVAVSLISLDQVDELVPILSGMPSQQQLAYMLEHSPQARVAELDLDLPKLSTMWDVLLSLCAITSDYQPTGRVESVTVFHASPLSGTTREWQARLRRWEEFSRRPNRYVPVPGDHYTLMGPQHLSAFQSILRGELGVALGDG
jgi:acyl-CoA synthetase (AMP-forming)/AMP-acid ligase II/thioesterase domain-containing protein